MKLTAKSVRTTTRNAIRNAQRQEQRERKREEQFIRAHVKKEFPKLLEKAQRLIKKAAKRGESSVEILQSDGYPNACRDALLKKLEQKLSGLNARITSRFVEAGEEGYTSWTLEWAV